MREFCTKWWKRIATVDMLFIGVLTLLASLFASWLKQFPGFSLFGITPEILRKLVEGLR